MSALDNLIIATKRCLINNCISFESHNIALNMDITEINQILYKACLYEAKKISQNIRNQIIADFNNNEVLIGFFEEFHKFPYVAHDIGLNLLPMLLLDNFKTFYNTPQSLIDLLDDDDNCSDCDTISHVSYSGSDDESDDEN